MKISKQRITDFNKSRKEHQHSFSSLAEKLQAEGQNVDRLLTDIGSFQIAIPSWALGAGGTRFGRFSIGGEPANLKQKIADVGLLHALNRSSDAISLHIPWDIPDDVEAVRQQAEALGIQFDAVNSNTFQDQPGQELSYKHGSLSHTDKKVQDQAINHNIEVINYGKQLGSNALTLWLADGSSFPGQQSFRGAFERTMESLETIYKALPSDWKLLVEYKPYEPNFYSMVIPDWGTSFLMASKLGPKAFTLVDLGHHLPNTNIEQIVATLLMEERLGGFHFNDSKYGDDDLTTGAIKPYQLFLIFSELIDGSANSETMRRNISWMIDASHNIKDPLEDLLQSVEAIKTAYAKALLIDRKELLEARENNDPAHAQQVLHDAFQTDVRPLLKEARRRNGAALEPLTLYRELEVRRKLTEERGTESRATGL